MCVKVIAIFKLTISIYLSITIRKQQRHSVEMEKQLRTQVWPSGLLSGVNRKFGRKFHRRGAYYPPLPQKWTKDQRQSVVYSLESAENLAGYLHKMGRIIRSQMKMVKDQKAQGGLLSGMGWIIGRKFHVGGADYLPAGLSALQHGRIIRCK